MYLRRLLRSWLLALGILTLLTAAGWPLPAAEGRLAPARGMLLVAGEGIADPRFQESVILLVRYDAEGVVGVILNRPTNLSLGEALPGMVAGERRDAPLYYGGPVDPRLLLVLLQSDKPPRDSTPVAGRLHLTGLPQIADRLDSSESQGEKFMVLLGYAGWSAGQLAGEIARGDWYLVPFDETAVFSERPENLWDELRGRGKEIWI